jgi:lantibiotic protection ABC transporter MutG family permease subunit
MFPVLSSDWLKTKRSAFRRIALILPVVYPLVMLWYFSLHRQTPEFQVYAYEIFFNTLTIFIPLLAGLLSGILCAQEEQAGSFNGLLSEAVPRAKLFCSKLLLLILAPAADLLLSVLILLAGMAWLFHLPDIQGALFLEGALFTVMGSLVLYTFHLWLGFAFGLGASVAAGGAGFLIAAICGLTSAGDRIWRFLPWTWPARLSLIPERILPGAHAAVPATSSQSFLQQAEQGLAPAMIVFLFLTACVILWFNRWEGRRSYE